MEAVVSGNFALIGTLKNTTLKKTMAGDNGRLYDVDITYIAPHGSWYHRSWKGQT